MTILTEKDIKTLVTAHPQVHMLKKNIKTQQKHIEKLDAHLEEIDHTLQYLLAHTKDIHTNFIRHKEFSKFKQQVFIHFDTLLGVTVKWDEERVMLSYKMEELEERVVVMEG